MEAIQSKIEVVNRFTGAVKVIIVDADKAFKALNHYRSLCNTGTVRILPTR